MKNTQSQNQQKKSRTLLYIVLGILALGTTAVAAGALYASSLLQPVSGTVAETERFVIPRGQAVSVIGQRLESEGLIRNKYAFRYAVEMNNLSNDIQAGSFDLSASMSTTDIAIQLTQGTEDTWITILEGWRVEEIAESLAQQDIDGFDPEVFLEIAAESEGMLYPDTYLIPREMSEENIHNLLLNTFERKVTQGLAEAVTASEYDFDEALVMASLVEREARTYDQMQLVAGILWKRIEIGMPLQVDATLQYVAGYNTLQQDWWAPPTPAQKELDSPFNTYQNPGLPPAPIANPSLNAMQAALDPRETNDLYYIHAPDGNMYTAATLQEHNANINQYLR